jgi:hypothetical protein
MLRLLLLLLIPSIPVQAVELLRDRHASEEYVFETDQTEMTATVDAAGATLRATDWATYFYEDLLHIVDCEFRTNQPDSGSSLLRDLRAVKRSTPSYSQMEASSSLTH